MNILLQKSVFGFYVLASVVALSVLPTMATATTSTYELTNGWAPYGNQSGVYFYKPGAAFYGDFEAGAMFLDLTQTSGVSYDAKIYGTFLGNFQTQNGQLSVDPNQNANQFNSTEGEYSLELSFTLTQLFPHKYPNNFSTLTENVVGSITNPLGVSSAVSLAVSEQHGIAFGINFLEDETIHGAGWFNVAGGSSFTGVHGDFFFDGSLQETPPPTEIPEPGTLALLSVGALSLLRKRQLQ